MTPDDGGTSDESPDGDDTDVSSGVTEEFPSIGATTDETASPSDGVGEVAADEGSGGPDPSASTPTAVESKSGEGLGWRGWVLVAALIVAMVLVPWALVFLPEMQGFVESLGLGLRDAYLVLPMIPAVGLGFLAVWAAVRSRQTD